MSIGAALIIGGATLLGGFIQSQGLQDATDAQTKANQDALDLQQQLLDLQGQQFGDIKDTLDPFIQTGEDAFNLQAALSGALGPEAQQAAFDNFKESPGQDFLRQQGLRDIERNLSATGGLLSGNRLKALTQFNQGLAQQDLMNQFNRLGAVSGGGFSALGNLTGATTNFGNTQANTFGNISDLLLNQGNITAGGLTGQSGILGNTIGNLGLLGALGLGGFGNTGGTGTGGTGGVNPFAPPLGTSPTTTGFT